MWQQRSVAMDFNEYALEALVRDRLEALRVAATRRRLALPPRPVTPLRAHIGHALIRAGQWLLRATPAAPAQTVATR